MSSNAELAARLRRLLDIGALHSDTMVSSTTGVHFATSEITEIADELSRSPTSAGAVTVCETCHTIQGEACSSEGCVLVRYTRDGAPPKGAEGICPICYHATDEIPERLLAERVFRAPSPSAGDATP